MKNQVQPYKNSFLTKGKQIQKMFDRISSRYDFINHILSFGIDVQWRKKLVYRLARHTPNRILDIATGTGDLAILSAQKISNAHIIGMDISEGMLRLSRKKVIEKKLSDRIRMVHGDSENIPFKEDYFDAITVSFGIRNFENLSSGLLEMYRVLKPEGHLLILEFSTPLNLSIKKLYSLYIRNILPFIGKILSEDKEAYAYLPESMATFPFGKEMEMILIEAGFYDIELLPLTFGVATIYISRKKVLKNFH